MATHSIILDWKNPWTVESVGLKAHQGRKELDMACTLSHLEVQPGGFPQYHA